MFYVWLIIILMLGFIEAITVGLVSIWFVISGLVSLLLSFFTDNIFIQFFVFVILGIILMLLTKKSMEKFLKIKKESTNIDRIIGMKGIVTEEIKVNAFGEVKVDGKCWTAYADKKINVNTYVKVLKIDGVKLKVESWEE